MRDCGGGQGVGRGLGNGGMTSLSPLPFLSGFRQVLEAAQDLAAR